MIFCYKSGQQAWELHVVHGLETNVVQDLASEVNLTVDWEGYEKAKAEKVNISFFYISLKMHLELFCFKCVFLCL